MDVNERVEELIKEYREQRDALKVMIVDLEKIKQKVNTLFPETLDKRYAMFFEQKVKAATGLFSAVLDIRKEISKSIKDEMEMVRKIDTTDKEDDISNIAEIASQVAELQKESQLKSVKRGSNNA